MRSFPRCARAPETVPLPRSLRRRLRTPAKPRIEPTLTNSRIRFHFSYSLPLKLQNWPNEHTQLRNCADDTHSEMSIHSTPGDPFYSSIALPSVCVVYKPMAETVLYIFKIALMPVFCLRVSSSLLLLPASRYCIKWYSHGTVYPLRKVVIDLIKKFKKY